MADPETPERWSRGWDERGGGDVELRESESVSRPWWQSAAAGQAVAAGLRPGQSEEPDTLDPASRASKCKYVR